MRQLKLKVFFLFALFWGNTVYAQQLALSREEAGLLLLFMIHASPNASSSPFIPGADWVDQINLPNKPIMTDSKKHAHTKSPTSPVVSDSGLCVDCQHAIPQALPKE